MTYLTLILCLIMSTVAFAAPTPDSCGRFSTAVNQGNAKRKLERFISTQWEYYMSEHPEWATYVAHPGRKDDAWTDMSLAAIQHREHAIKCQADALAKIRRAELTGVDVVNYDLLRQRLDMDLAEQKFDGKYLLINHLDGPQTEIPGLIEAMNTANVQAFENILARLDKVPVVLEQTEVLLREGLKRKVTPVKMFLARVPAQFDKLLPANVEDSPLYTPFKDIRDQLSADEKARVQAQAKEVLKGKVYPAFAKLRQFLDKEYIPNARESISFKDMPNGAEWYAFQIKRYTTTNMGAEQLHQLGLSEVARLNAEMTKVKDQVKFKGNLAAFNKHLMTDKKFFYSSKEDLLAGFRDIAKRADPELTKQFRALPRLQYGVREMPEYKAKDAPAAYYQGGNLEAGRPGYFEANTYDLKSRPRWGMEALTLHEAVPGHHLQIAIAQEQQNVPMFRRFAGYTAFIEGWALYAEGLGEEMGFYKDPYSKYGQLSYEMWRAIRLVVDTGVHHLGWSREQAVKYFLDNMPKSRMEAEVEVDRYITWPGQALAYKVGQLKFRELREHSRQTLGDAFDVREFHDLVLKNGALPLDVLEANVKAWLTSRSKMKTKKAA